MENILDLFQLAFTYLLIIDPWGSAPLVMSLLRNYDIQKQKKIIFRECVFAFIIAILFHMLGARFLKLLNIDPVALSLCGGIILFLLGLEMIFPRAPSSHELEKEPFIVPIAIPLLAGPGFLSIIMLTSANQPHPWTASLAIFIACVGMLIIIMLAPYLQKKIGKIGMIVLEHLSGLILILMATQMIVAALYSFGLEWLHA